MLYLKKLIIFTFFETTDVDLLAFFSFLEFQTFIDFVIKAILNHSSIVRPW